MLEPSYTSPQAFRSRESVRRTRDAEDHRRLARGVDALVLASVSVRSLGNNTAVAGLAEELGLGAHDYVCVELALEHRRATIVCVPTRLWHQPYAMATFFRLKEGATVGGHRTVLVPESFIRRQPRLDNAMMVSAAADIDIDASDRMSILAFLLENGGGTLAEVASLVGHPDPVGAVLHLVTVGALDIDLDAPILPTSQVHLASAVW
jgi:hypothetical protein